MACAAARCSGVAHTDAAKVEIKAREGECSDVQLRLLALAHACDTLTSNRLLRNFWTHRSHSAGGARVRARHLKGLDVTPPTNSHLSVFRKFCTSLRRPHRRLSWHTVPSSGMRRRCRRLTLLVSATIIPRMVRDISWKVWMPTFGWPTGSRCRSARNGWPDAAHACGEQARPLVTTVHLGAIQCSANVAECRRCSADYDATSRTQGLGLRGTKPRGAPRCAGWRAQMQKGDGRQQLEKASFCAAPARAFNKEVLCVA